MTKVTVSSGAKKKARATRNGNRKPSNLLKGVNPNTGKEFLIIGRTGNKLVIVDSYQTRVGAKAVRKEGQFIILREKLAGWIAGHKGSANDLQARINVLQQDINKQNTIIKRQDSTPVEKKAAKFKKSRLILSIKPLQEFTSFDFSNLK